MIKFKDGDIDKRDRIINAALEEFGNNAFNKASTNTIVKRAGVSKGLLYHYFESKEELYYYLIEFCFKTISLTLKNEMNWEITDFFERLKEATRVKFELTKKYPHIYDFAVKNLVDLSNPKLQELMEKYSIDLLAKVYYENIDFSLFKEGIDINRAIRVIQWTFEKYGEAVRMSDDIDIDEIFAEVEKYIALFKQGFYK